MSKTRSGDGSELTSPAAPPSTRATSPQPPSSPLDQAGEMPLGQPEGAEGEMGMCCWHYGCLNTPGKLENVYINLVPTM